MIITKELLESLGASTLIPEELLPIEVEQLFDAPISTEDKVQVLLHEEILGRRGLVYVVARAARRAGTVSGWRHPDSLRALDLCDRYASGEEIPEEELREASKAASWDSRAAEAAAWASRTASRTASKAAAWAASSAAFSAFRASAEAEREAQLEDCREWILRSVPKESTPVPTRYQRIMNWKASD